MSVTQTGMGRSERKDTVQDTVCQSAEWVGVEVLFLSEGTAWEGHGFCEK